jgi:tetratricopeptide (TPR) repeat protein
MILVRQAYREDTCGHYGRAWRLAGEALRLMEQSGDVRPDDALPLQVLAYHEAEGGDLRRAEAFCEQALACAQRDGNLMVEGIAQFRLGDLAQQHQRYDIARKWYRAALATFEGALDQVNEAATLGQLAGLACLDGSRKKARKLAERMLHLAERLDDGMARAGALTRLADATSRAEDVRRLRHRVVELLAVARAWPELFVTLRRLAAATRYAAPDEANGYLAQALWLGLRVEVSASTFVAGARDLFDGLAPGHAAALPLAAMAVRLARDPIDTSECYDNWREAAEQVLAACAAHHHIATRRVDAWLGALRLIDPRVIRPMLSRDLAQLVPVDAWLFDRDLVPPLRSEQR